jgi:hypothetical protein
VQNEEKRTRREDDLEITGPLGWKLRASGRQLVQLLFVAAAVFIVVYMIRDHDLRQTAAMEAVTQARSVQMRSMAEQQDRLKDSLDNILYVSLLSQEQRSQLKLDMPPALRAKLLTQERPR